MHSKVKDVLELFGLEPETVEWIDRQEYMEASTDDLIDLHKEYKTLWLAEDADKVFLLPKEA